MRAMLHLTILLGIAFSHSDATEMTWHYAPDCSDDAYNKMDHFHNFDRGAVPSECKPGAKFIGMDVDMQWNKCNETHLGMTIYTPKSKCTVTFGALAVPVADVKKLYSGECVAVFSECCSEEGAWKEVPDVNYVKLHGYKGATPLCPHCATIPTSLYDQLVEKGIRPITCQEDKQRRRLAGLPEGPPCPGSAKKRNLRENPRNEAESPVWAPPLGEVEDSDFYP